MVEINVIGDFNAALENKFKKDIRAVSPGEPFLVNITSNGGELEVLKRMAAEVYKVKKKGSQMLSFVPEYANSCGFFFFLLGDHRDMEETASVHYHPPRVKLGEGFVGTARNLNEITSELNKYQKFTNQIFRGSCDISDELFSLIENSELPMNRGHLKSLGIINQN